MTVRRSIKDAPTAAMTRAVSASSLAQDALRLLKSRGKKRTAAQASKFFKSHERIWTYGVSTPEFRRIEKDLFQTIRGQWSVDDAFDFCDLLIRTKYMESKAVGLLFLSRYRREFVPAFLRSAEGWLKEDLCNNWALVDTLCPTIISPLIDKYPNLIPKVKAWSRSANIWMRRSSLVAFIPLVRRGRALDDAYEVARSLFKDDEDLIHKATGWMLREAGKTDPARLRGFLLEHGPQIPRTAVRYAIERFPEKDRKKILAETKPEAVTKR